MGSYASPHTAARRSDNEVVDELFWLAKLDESIPRAHIAPHFRRPPSGRHDYKAVQFSLQPHLVQALKSVDTVRGVSDVALCAGLVTVLFAKYQDHDALIAGLQRPADDGQGRTFVVPLRLPCRQDEDAQMVMRTLTEEASELMRHLPLTAERMAQVLGIDVGGSRCPFFDVAIAVERGEVVFDFEAYPVDMAFLFAVKGGSISGRLVYAADLFDGAVMDRAVSHLLSAANTLCQDPARKIAQIDLLSPDERRRILHEFAGPQLAFPLDSTITALFEEQVRRTPGAIAVIHGARALTYEELNLGANLLAQTLLAYGLRKGDFVCILLERSSEFLTAMLAVFKAGGAYVPLDPTYPRERVRYMLEDSGAAFVISNVELMRKFDQVLGAARELRTVLCVDGEAVEEAAARPFTVIGRGPIQRAKVDDPVLGLSGRDRAYMIYTSGSTGRPKGAICRHDGALNHLYGELHGLGIDGPFRFLQAAASSSDISVWQFVAPLLFGGATVIADYDVVVDPSQLFAVIRDSRITIAELVPVVLRALVDHVSSMSPESRLLPDLRFMMATGEALPTPLVERWFGQYPQVPLANTYGPTETSDDVTLLVLREALVSERAVVPIGRPLPNTHVFILDRNLQPLPSGIPGEICVAGIGVGEGYWQQPEKTSLAFVPCPFPDVAAGLMYRSGDLGRWLADGSVEFLGRMDQQVKVRGFRVEPGEIEATLIRHPAIQDAVVVAASDASGTARLVAYYVTRKDQPCDAGELRQFLNASLAEHMVPAALVRLGALPLTPLGKVDRRAIERLQEEGETADTNYTPPTNRTEAIIADAWSMVLGRRRIGVHDNFFEIGGHSISTIHIIAELRKSGVNLVPKQFFLHPTVARLAEVAALTQPGSTSGVAELPREQPRSDSGNWREQLQPVLGEVTDVYPLGATQEGIYLQTVLPAKSSGAYIEQIGFDLLGKLDEDAFFKAWQHVVNSTDVLRTAVVRRGVPHPMQAVLRNAALRIEVVDWRQLNESAQDAAYRAVVEQDRRKGFDLRMPPLTRATLIRLAEQHYRVLWTYHHIILDGWSEPLVLRAVFNAYAALMDGRLPAPEVGNRFGDFIAWSAAQDRSAAKSFWRRQLSGFTSPVTIRDNSAAIEAPAIAEISHGSHSLVLSEAETNRIEQMARRNKLTFGTVVHGAWALLLHERTGAKDLIFGSVASGRQSSVPNADTLRGVLVNTQPVRTRSVADTSASSWLRSLQLSMAEIREYEHTPLGAIQQWSDVPAERRPLFDTIVVVANYTGADLAQCQLPGLRLSKVQYYTQPLFALTLFVVPGERLSLQLIYEKKRYAPSTVRGLLDDYRHILIGLAENPDQRVTSLIVARH
jgi:amino acid adenylation domain-containing protein